MSRGERTILGGFGGAAIGGSIALLASGPIGLTALGGAAVGALFGLLK